MGYAVGYENDRWVGYGVLAECDMPHCTAKIDRGLGWKCEHVWREVPVDENGAEVEEDEAYDFIEREEDGCGLFFCADHLYSYDSHAGVQPKPDSAEWRRFQLVDPSWAVWRRENGIPEPEGVYETMPVDQILRDYRNGDETSWELEFTGLRSWDRDKLDMLATSIQETGMREPIMLGYDGRVWDGHHRLAAAVELGLETVPTIRIVEPTL